MLNRLKTCCVKGCGRPVVRSGFTVNTRGWCSAHWQRLKRLGDVMAHKPIIEKHRGCNLNEDGTQKRCMLAGCGRPATSRGVCHMHWKRMGRNGGIPYGDIPVGELREHKAALRVERAG